jgi:hypothetical protein
MKKLLLFVIAVVLAFTYAGCKKSSSEKPPETFTCTTCKNTPDAVAANDASAKGIYKGVLIGSTGTIKFDVSNSGTTVTATMIIDGATVVLTSNVNYVAGQAYTSNFTGTMGGQAVSVHFSVGAGGQDPSVTTADIPGHPNITFILVKETSTALIEGFEGTYSTSKGEAGTFNILLSRAIKRWGALVRKNGASQTSDEDGIINGNDLMDDGHILATITGDAIEGHTTDNNGNTVTVKGKRTM